MYDDIADETGYADRTLRLVKETAEKIESGRRLPELSFSHHVEVASLPPEWLDTFYPHGVRSDRRGNETEPLVVSDHNLICLLLHRGRATS